jgi:hypothetical protein
MKITRISPFSNKKNTIEVNCTEQQYDRWIGGELIHLAMPNVSAEHREFILTGITPEEWNETFSNNEDPSYRKCGEDILSEEY